MTRVKPAQWRLLISLAIVMPLVTLMATHVWLRSAYTGKVFHLQGFVEQYGGGVYRYRILGPDLLLAIYHFLLRHGHDAALAMPSDPSATRFFYTSYVLLNGACLFVSNLALLLLLWNRRRGISDLRCAFYLFAWLILVLSTYTVTPYDQLAYAVMLLAFLAAGARPQWVAYAGVGIAAVLGGLTRETEFLVSPALWTIAIFLKDSRSRRFAGLGHLHIGLFAVCYIGLRIKLGGQPTIAQGLNYGGGWKVAISGVLVLGAVVGMGLALFTRAYAARKPGMVFLGLSLPYLVTILLSGVLWELRLVVPIVLCHLFVYTQLDQSETGPTAAAGSIAAESASALEC